MKKNLSQFANYCRDRGISCLFTGSNGKGTLLFTVYGFKGLRALSERVRRNFEKRLAEDNPEAEIDVLYM